MLILSGQELLLHLKAVLYLQHFSSHGLHSYLLCLEWSGHGDGGHVLRPEKSCQIPNIFVIQILRFPRLLGSYAYASLSPCDEVCLFLSLLLADSGCC